MKAFRRSLLVLCAGLLVALAGCSGGGKGSTVKGVVTLDDQPVGHARLTFRPVDPASKIGGDEVTADENGNFEIKPHRKKFGLRAGKYYVLVEKWVDPKTGKQPEEKEGEDLEQLKLGGKLRNLVPPRFSSLEFPEGLIQVEIKDGENNDVKIALKSK